MTIGCDDHVWAAVSSLDPADIVFVQLSLHSGLAALPAFPASSIMAGRGWRR